MYPVKFKAIPVERIWGGHRLKKEFGVDSEQPIGEYWLISGYPDALSVVQNGPLKGKSLLQLTEEYPEEFLGHSPQPRFPLLIKLLEAEQDLSVQVHPDDEYAQAHEHDYGKTEAWYVVDCTPGGKVNYGHRFTSREEYLKAVQDKKVKDYLEYLRIHKGDVVFVPARTLHALLAGIIVLEVQQTSDVTYRVYDWDRVDARGKGRELHVEKAADALTYAHAYLPHTQTESEPTKHHHTPEVLVQREFAVHERLLTSPYFTLDRVSLDNTSLSVKTGRLGNPDAWIILEGDGELRFGQSERISLTVGDALLVPASIHSYELTSNKALRAIRAFY